MKAIILAVFSTVLVVAYCQMLPHFFRKNIKVAEQQSNGVSARNGFRPEKSLVFITDRRRLRVGGALVNVKCVITVIHPLLKFANREESPRNLFIGIGTEPFDKNVDKYLHPVIDVKYDEEGIPPGIYTIGIIMFHPIRLRIPGDVQLIPVPEDILTYGMHRVEAVSVGWSKDGKISKNRVTTLHKDMRLCFTALICENEEHPKLDHHYVGGFLTINETLMGLVTIYNRTGLPSNVIKLTFIPLDISERFMNIASGGELILSDIQKERSSSDEDSSNFSNDEDE